VPIGVKDEIVRKITIQLNDLASIVVDELDALPPAAA
jgi:hypothetical protein